MMKSDTISSILLKKIDELNKQSHSFLDKDDEVYFLGEYTAKGGYAHSFMNQLIINYKKEPDRKDKPEWHYKLKAINQAAEMFRISIENTVGLSERLKNAILVPIPPSASKDDPKYDDRNYQLLKTMFPKGKVRELVTQNGSRAPLHEGGSRDPSLLKKNYKLDSHIIIEPHHEIWLFDDTLIGGTHFRAISDLLRAHFPQNPIVGFLSHVQLVASFQKFSHFPLHLAVE